MKKQHHTAILEFEVISPTNDVEVVGGRFSLNDGVYISNCGKMEYSFLRLLDHPAHYRVSKIMMNGINYVLPPDREKNYKPTFHPETYKYIVT